MAEPQEIEISQEAKDELQQIKKDCRELAKESKEGKILGEEYFKLLDLKMLEQIQLKINWNKVAQRQK